MTNSEKQSENPTVTVSSGNGLEKTTVEHDEGVTVGSLQFDMGQISKDTIGGWISALDLARSGLYSAGYSDGEDELVTCADTLYGLERLLRDMFEGMQQTKTDVAKPDE